MKYEAARTALMECVKIDECKEWADKSQALASYAKQSKNKELEHTAMRIRARAIRRCGELLREVEKATGEHLKRDGGDPLSRKKAADEAGLSERQRKDAIRIAGINGDSFESQVESENPPTVSKLAEQGKKKGLPIYERLGISKEAFQAGMYFRGSLEDYVKETDRFEPKDVIDGSNKEERQVIKRNIKLIEKYHNKLIGKL